jgi:hypothetical protein
MASALRANSDEVGSMLEWSGMAFLRPMVRRNRGWDGAYGVIAPPP